MNHYRNFHAGEAQLQEESGVDTAEFDAGVEQPFQPELNPSEQRFVETRTFSVAASRDDSERPWASPLIGEAGHLFSVEDLTTVRVRPRRIVEDPLFNNIRSTGEVGILYFNPSIRRRAKSLGRGEVASDGSIIYRMHRMFGLCPKYIFKRSHVVETADSISATAPAATVSDQLSADDQTQLISADTIFLASHSKHGTDPTHRGGPPGFVTVVDDKTLSLPDYLGNGMFQTLGNVLLDDRIGLLSVDFATGRTLQLTGHATIEASDQDDAFSTRTLIIKIDQVRASHAAVGTWTDIEAFEFVPGLVNPGTPRVTNP